MPVVFQKYHTQVEQEIAFLIHSQLTLVVFVPYEPMHIILPV